MQYNISQLIQEPTGSKRTYEINEDSFDVEGFDASDIKGQILLTKTDIGRKNYEKCKDIIKEYIQSRNQKEFKLL